MKIIDELEKLGDAKKAIILKKFFKTGAGEYGEGDIFLGINVPEQRVIAKKYCDISYTELKKLITSDIHEHRLTGFFILVLKYKKDKKKAFEFYLENIRSANNWDLVDCSCLYIIGDYLIDKDRKLLYELSRGNLWERRIAIISTFAFIKKGEYNDTLKIAEILIDDKHDLIHKAVGWMLREVGKRIGVEILEDFLQKHKKMPRTMLRYAIERFDEDKRKYYLNLAKQV